MRRKICVAIGESTVDLALKVARKVSAADVIEIRLDYFQETQCQSFINELSPEVLFTCRPKWEGGRFEGSEEERLGILQKAVLAGADYVDIELESGAEMHQQLDETIRRCGGKTRKIVSHHDFLSTENLDNLVQLVEKMIASSADIGKLITTAKGSADVLRVFNLLEYARSRNFPMISFCMGEAGAVSRVAGCEMGSYMTYCAADGQPGTAPGQINVTALNTIYSLYP